MPKPVKKNKGKNPEGLNGLTKRPKVQKKYAQVGTKAYKNRISDICPQCSKHFVHHNSKFGFCYWCDKLAKEPELKRS